MLATRMQDAFSIIGELEEAVSNGSSEKPAEFPLTGKQRTCSLRGSTSADDPCGLWCVFGRVRPDASRSARFNMAPRDNVRSVDTTG